MKPNLKFGADSNDITSFILVNGVVLNRKLVLRTVSPHGAVSGHTFIHLKIEKVHGIILSSVGSRPLNALETPFENAPDALVTFL